MVLLSNFHFKRVNISTLVDLFPLDFWLLESCSLTRFPGKRFLVGGLFQFLVRITGLVFSCYHFNSPSLALGFYLAFNGAESHSAGLRNQEFRVLLIHFSFWVGDLVVFLLGLVLHLAFLELWVCFWLELPFFSSFFFFFV